MTWRQFAPFARPALVNGAAGAVAFDGDTPFAIIAFTVVDDRAVSVDFFNDRELVPRLVRWGK
jgi:RNA polymerase sigma-70 factor (ECF subfamily)